MKALPRRAAWSPTALLLSAWLSGCSAAQTSERDADAPLAAAQDCGTRVERCNARDDDCDGIIDEQADSSCGLAHAASSCVRGTCVIDRCSQQYYNCNRITSDGCESEVECGACRDDCEPATQAESMAEGAPDSAATDASTPVTTARGPQTAEPSSSTSATGDDADGGEAQPGGTQTSEPESDAGASCDAEGCAGRDNACEAAASTGQGAKCDRCVCESCPEALASCTGTDDDEWNTLCGDILTCFGKSVQAGLCAGPDSDCFQDGDGPCATEFRSAFSRGWICTADPVRTPCGALTRVRLECYEKQCAAFCKL